MFGSRPLDGSEMGKGLVRCLRCGRVNLESAVGEHKRESTFYSLSCKSCKTGSGLTIGICGHVLDGTPLTSKKSKPTESKKRRASEGESFLTG